MTTFAPTTIKALRDLWVANGGVDDGIVGDTSHVATGTSYHLGKSALVAGAYSATLPRDVAGLSEAASAFDFGPLHGSRAELQAFSKWLVTTLPINGLVREVIYSPDGVNVQRWSGVDGLIHTGPGNGDSSHTGHTHISFFRDTEFLAKTQLIAPYFDTAQPAPPEAPVNMGTPINVKAANGTFTTGPNGATSWRVRNGSDGAVGAGESQVVVGQGDLDGANIAGGVVSDVWFTSKDGELYAYPKTQGTFKAADAPVTTPTTDTEAQKQYDADALALAEHLLGKRP